MVWIHDVVERDAVFMNPMKPEKFLGLARQLGLSERSHVLEIGAGRGGPAMFLAAEFGCAVTAVEPHEPFLVDARARVATAGLSDRVSFVHANGRSFEIESERFDAAFCLGATFAYDGLEGTLDALAPGVRPGGYVVAGEPYRKSDEPVHPMHPWSFPEIIERFEERSLPVVWFVRSSVDEWDGYTSVHLRDLLTWADEHPDDADAVRTWRREQLDTLSEPYMGWAVVAGRKS